MLIESNKKIKLELESSNEIIVQYKWLIDSISYGEIQKYDNYYVEYE